MKNLISILAILLISSPCLALEYKTKEIKEQFKELEKHNRSLALIVKAIDKRFKKDLKRDVVLTEVFRTFEEQDKIYGKNASISPHMIWEAVDIRTHGLKDKDIRALVFALNNTFNEINTYPVTAIFHDIGLGPHLHIQFR